jgi:outer membrane receptor protein involved in Fe transport
MQIRTILTLAAAVAAPAAALAQQSDEVVQLNPLEVVSERSSGYNVTTASTATRTNTPLIDIPQTVDINTSAFWNDLDATSWDQSFAYLANTEVRNRFAGFGDGVNIRGFQNFTNSMAEDGMLVGDQKYKRDLAGYDRIEVVKGPPSAVQGRAAGTAYINWILKKPDLGPNFETAKLMFMDDENGLGGVRLDFDTNATFDNRAMGFRLAGAYQNSDEYMKFMHTRMMDLYPSFRWKATPSTEIVVTNELMKDLTPSREEGHGFAVYSYKDRVLFPMFNVPSDPITALHLPMDFNLSGPGEDEYQEVVSSTVFLTQKIASWLSYRQAVNVRANSIDSAAWTDENNSTPLINYAYIHTILEYHNLNVQGDLDANYTLNKWFGGYTLVGYNYRDEWNTSTIWTALPNPAPFLHPVVNAAGKTTGEQIDIRQAAAAGNSAAFYAGRSVPAGPPTTYTYSDPANFGAYAEQAVGLFNNRLLLNASLRRDHDHTRTFNYIANAQTATSDTQLSSYRYGVTFKIAPNIAIYAVESLQNNPPVTTQKYNGLLPGDPRLAEFFTVSPTQKLYEYGIKTELLDGRLSFTADHWQMNVTGSTINLLQVGTSQGQTVTFGTTTLLTGSESHGFEFESYGALTDRLSLIANFTRMFTSVQNSADPTNPGDLVPLAMDPIWSGNAYLKYDFHDPTQDGFELRGGYRVIGPFIGQVTLTTGAVQIPVPHSQYTIDLGARYSWRNYVFDLAVNNVNDSPFLITRDIAPRNYRISASIRF